jgi:hypothetical protein
VGHGKLRLIGNMLALWSNKVMMDLILQIIIALNQLYFLPPFYVSLGLIFLGK